MRRSRRRLALLLLLALAAAPAAAEEAGVAGMDLLLQTVRNNERALVAVNLELGDEEAAAFWPVYDRYEAERTVVDERLAKVIEDYKRGYGTLTDEEARRLVDEYLAAERDRAAVRLAYVEPFAEVLPGRTLMRFFQLQNKIDAILRYDLAASIPVVEQ